MGLRDPQYLSCLSLLEPSRSERLLQLNQEVRPNQGVSDGAVVARLVPRWAAEDIAC
jgi:hypothetical protein